MNEKSPLPRFLRQLGAAAWLNEGRTAVAMLTRQKLFRPLHADMSLAPRAVALFPVIGAVIGLIGAVVDSIGGYCNLPPIVTAPLAFCVMIWLTGALNEEGLASFADGCCADAAPPEPLAVMPHSRIGVFGVVTLILSLTLRLGAMASLSTSLSVFAALITANAVSRAVMPPVAAWLLPAGAVDEISVMSQPSGMRIIISLLIAIAIAFLFEEPVTAGLSVGAAFLSALAIALTAQRQIGGCNRDVLSTVQQTAEAAILIVAVAAQ